jgi:Fe-Mn family superoxide dismutase
MQSSHDIDRRHVLGALGAGTIVIAATGGLGACTTGALGQYSSPAKPAIPPDALGWNAGKREYVLPPLPYPYEALEPHIDAQTMRLHHEKHHAGYVRGLNTALEQLRQIRAGQSKESVKHWSRELAFHGSGHLLHVVFWNCMGPGGGGEPGGALRSQIERDFGSFAAFASHFKAAANAVEGGGWGILALEPTAGQLLVMQAEKHQDLTAWGVVPVLAIDVWEHAYYLKYQNRRPEYVDAFMNVINGGWVVGRCAEATKQPCD